MLIHGIKHRMLKTIYFDAVAGCLPSASRITIQLTSFVRVKSRRQNGLSSAFGHCPLFRWNPFRRCISVTIVRHPRVIFAVVNRPQQWAHRFDEFIRPYPSPPNDPPRWFLARPGGIWIDLLSDAATACTTCLRRDSSLCRTYGHVATAHSPASFHEFIHLVCAGMWQDFAWVVAQGGSGSSHSIPTPHENLIPCRLTDSNICPNLRVSFARNQFALFDLHHPQKNEYNYGRITCTTKQEVCRIQNEFIYFNKKFINMRGILFDSHVRSKNIKYIFQKMFSNAAHICGIFLVSLQLGEIPNLSVISLSLAKESEKLLPPNKLSTF